MPAWDREWKWSLAHPRLALIILSLLVLIPGLFTLPPLDRDESRFAQATKQMLETGDFVEIRFQDEARNKKPVGIYWLQALSAGALTAPPHSQIWAYRIPSILGAIAAALLVFALGQRLFDRATGLLAACFLAVSVSLVVEGHIAKTDAMLLATIVAAQWALAHIYLGRRMLTKALSPEMERGLLATPAPWALIAVFWLAIGASILVKGPVGPFVIFATLITLAISDRDWRLLVSVRPLVGIMVAALVVLPWGIAIWIETDGQFFRDALVGDFGDKLVEGQERHGGWPGYYLLVSWVMFWPATLMLAPAVVDAWRNRNVPQIRFLIAWIVPAWVIFEIIPTKLPHYVLPLYPALALLCAATLMKIERGASDLARHWTMSASMIVFAIVSLVLAASLMVLPAVYGTGIDMVSALAALVLVAMIGLVLSQAIKRRFHMAAIASWIVAFLLYLGLFQLAVPRMEKLLVSTRTAELIDAARTRMQRTDVAATGYAEPSLVFLAGTQTQLGTIFDTAAFLAADPTRMALIEKQFDQNFRNTVAAQGLNVIEIGQIDGINYSKGDPVVLSLYALEPRQR
jgi:4-amino-4-deoxy-L-arabinose transferase-like glycosyltransferase